jgi:hypothetical protein
VAGQNADFWVLASGTPTLTYQWSLNGTPLSGANGPLLVVPDVQTANLGLYTVRVSNPEGASTSSAVNLALIPGGVLPPFKFSFGPFSGAVAFGEHFFLSISGSTSGGIGSSAGGGLTARADSGVTYQWFLNDNAIVGATDSTYAVDSATTANSGTYVCIATDASGIAESTAATINVVSTTNPGRLINLSSRAQVGTGTNQLITGYVVGGTGTTGAQALLLRASGPALAPFGVTGVLPDPNLTLNGGGGVIASNSGWAGNAQVAAAATTDGAFAWSSAASHDSALVESLPAGAYTAEVTGASGDTGVALAEIYDSTPAGAYTLATPRLINLSARAVAGSGSGVLDAGFVIGGTTSRAVLIRVSGPALSGFGISGFLPDPQLQLYQTNRDGSSTLLETNVGWAGDTTIAATAADVGAFSWGTAATADSAIVVTLPPGAYTAEVAGAAGDSGVALVEVYEVP